MISVLSQASIVALASILMGVVPLGSDHGHTDGAETPTFIEPAGVG
jgi:hypothetical protein